MATRSSRRSSIVRWSRVICKEPGNYIGWPSIARTIDGELLVVFSGDREEHVCPFGKTELVRSRDGGETWSAAETINNTPLDDRDAGIIVLRTGTIVVSWFTAPLTLAYLQRWQGLHPESVLKAWERHILKISAADRQRWFGNWTRRSTDGGHTWEDAVDSIATTPHGAIELSDGRLLFVGTGRQDQPGLMLAMESADEGRSWHQIGMMPVPPEHSRPSEVPFDEPHCVESPGGRLICLWRHQPSYRSPAEWYLQQCESDDGGRTWSAPHPTPMWGFPAHLIRLHNGDLLATYGHRRPPFGQRVCLSHDGGETWDIVHEIVLRDDAANGDLGYPASLELSPGELLTVYYQIDRPGEKTSLMLTRWSLA